MLESILLADHIGFQVIPFYIQKLVLLFMYQRLQLSRPN